MQWRQTLNFSIDKNAEISTLSLKMSKIKETSQKNDDEMESEENELLKEDSTRQSSRKSSQKISIALETRKSTYAKPEERNDTAVSATPDERKDTAVSVTPDERKDTSASSRPDERKGTSTSARPSEKKNTLTKPGIKKDALAKSDFSKSATQKRDTEQLSTPKNDTPRFSIKSDVIHTESIKLEKQKRNSSKPETPKEDSIKDSPKQETVKADSSKHDSDFEDDKLIEFPGEAEIERLHFHKGPGFFYFPEKAEYLSIWGEDVSSEVSTASATALVSEVEETEEEREIRREREALIDSLRQKMIDRTLLRRRNTFLNKKLVEHFKKRRMENILKDEAKGLDLESKYLRSLYAYKEFNQLQEKEIAELTYTMEKYEEQIKQLEADLEENLKNSAARAKEVSLNLILTKTGKKINEKTVDRLLRRQIQKSEEKGKEKLKYIKIKNLIEEKELQLKAMEYFGEGLHIAVYEQMKIDNQNYSDKIEEKEDELTKLRLKTQTMIQNLAHVREKIYAVEGDIELMEEKAFDVEKTFVETRERLTAARIKRDNLRSLFRRYKNASGLLTRTDLLRDFEESILKAKNLSSYLQRLKRSVLEKNRQENKLAKIISNANSAMSDIALPLRVKIRSRTSNALREVYVSDKAHKNSIDLWVRVPN